MKKLLFTLLLVGTFSSTSWSQTWNFGAGAQLFLDGGVFGIQGKALREIDDTWRAAGTFTIHFEEFFDWSIDLDAQYKLLEVSDNFDLAPVGGLSIQRYSFLGLASGTEVGINLGAFIDFVPSDSYHIYVEPKLILGGYDSIVISGGILF